MQTLEVTDDSCITLYHSRHRFTGMDGQKSSAARSILLESTHVLALMTNLWCTLRVTLSGIPTQAVAAADRHINVVITHGVGQPKFMLGEAIYSWRPGKDRDRRRKARKERTSNNVAEWLSGWPHATIIGHWYHESLIAETATGQQCMISLSHRYAGYTLKDHQRTR